MPISRRDIINAVTASSYASSRGHRNGERANGLTEIFTSSLQGLSPAAIIPTKFAQVGISTYSLFRRDTHVPEKVIHGAQTVFAAAQMGLAITLLYLDTECTAYNSSTLCKTMFALQLLYQGTLALGWAIGEYSKEPYEPVANTVLPS